MVRYIRFGRSGAHSRDDFYQEYLDIVCEKYGPYKNCTTQKGKRQLVEEVIAWVEANDGVFAKRDPESTTLEIVADAQEIYDKVSKAFRGRRNRKHLVENNAEAELDAALDALVDLMLLEDDSAAENGNEEPQWLAELTLQNETVSDTEVGDDLMDLSIGTFPVSCSFDGRDDESIATNFEDDDGFEPPYFSF